MLQRLSVSVSAERDMQPAGPSNIPCCGCWYNCHRNLLRLNLAFFRLDG